MDANGNVVKSSKELPTEPEGDSYFGGALKFRTKIVWPNAIGFLLIHLAGFYGVWLSLCQICHLQFLTTIYLYFIGWLGGEGTTAGAHRLWSHKSYKARRPLRILLIIMQTIAGQNCCYTWVRDHRQHHKYTDTDADPHNATRGFFYSHMGWLMMRKHPEVIRKGKGIDMSDLERDPVIVFQRRHFKKLFFTIGALIPVLIPCFLWGETLWNSIFQCFFFRYILLLNITWTVNSLAHLYGNKPYDKNILPSENAFVSFIGYGEGWHNYHHSFPWDYKASEFGMRLNFTRDMISFFERIGYAYDLKEASYDMVMRKLHRSGDGTHGSLVINKDKKLVQNHAPAPPEQQAVGW